jgi:hypothetical protein
MVRRWGEVIATHFPAYAVEFDTTIMTASFGWRSNVCLWTQYLLNANQ